MSKRSLFIVCLTVFLSMKAHATGAPTFDALNWAQNFITATENKLQTGYAATQNAQSQVANSHLFTMVGQQVQMIDSLVQQYQRVEAQAKWLMGDGKDFSHLLIPAFRPWAEGVDPTNWSELVNGTARFGNSACIASERTVTDANGNQVLEYYYPLTGERCLGDRSSVASGVVNRNESIRDMTYQQLVDRWYERNHYQQKNHGSTMQEEFETFRMLSTKMGLEAEFALDLVNENERQGGAIDQFTQSTDKAESLDELARLNNYILLQLMSVQDRALKLQSINTQYQAELLRIEHNKEAQKHNSLKW